MAVEWVDNGESVKACQYRKHRTPYLAELTSDNEMKFDGHVIQWHLHPGRMSLQCRLRACYPCSRLPRHKITRTKIQVSKVLRPKSEFEVSRSLLPFFPLALILSTQDCIKRNIWVICRNRSSTLRRSCHRLPAKVDRAPVRNTTQSP